MNSSSAGSSSGIGGTGPTGGSGTTGGASGLPLAIVRTSPDQPGGITVTATSEGLSRADTVDRRVSSLHTRSAFNGLALVIVREAFQPGGEPVEVWLIIS